MRNTQDTLYVKPSHIDKLPPETLGEIFTWCVPGTRDLPLDITPATAPMLLIHVCSAWRCIAHGTPQLWTRLAIDTVPAINPSITVPMWIHHSGSLPIDINFNIVTRQRWGGLGAEEMQRVVGPVAQNPWRCRSFQAPASFVWGLFPEERNTDASILRRFCIKRGASSRRPPELGSISAPQLEELDAIYPFPLLNSITFNHQVLRVVRWESWHRAGTNSWEQFAQFVASCPNLEECEIKYQESSPQMQMAPLAARSITLPHLRRLSLVWDNHSGEPDEFLSALQAPALEYLSLKHGFMCLRGSSDLVPTIHALLSSAPSRLKELRLCNIDLCHEDMVPLVKKFSRLETLDMWGVYLDHTLLLALTWVPGDTLQGWICPRLTTLRLGNVNVVVGDSGGQLVRMIKSRVAGYESSESDPEDLQHLISLSLSYGCGGFLRSDRVAMEELKACGLYIEGLVSIYVN